MCDRDFRFLESEKFKTSWVLFNHWWWRSAITEGAGAGLMQQSGQDLASWKCFSYIYCARGRKSWLCRTYQARLVEEDALLEVNDSRFANATTSDLRSQWLKVRVWQSPVHENGVFYTEVVQWGTTSVHTEVERKYTEVAARGTPVYLRGNLSENLGIPVNTCKLWGLQWKLESL